MALQVVNKSETFADWINKTNLISTSVGDPDNITTPIVPTDSFLAQNVITGGPRQGGRSRSWTGQSAIVNVVAPSTSGIRWPVGSIIILDGGSDYRVNDTLTITGEKVQGTSPENDVSFNVRAVDANGTITAVRRPMGSNSVTSLKSIVDRIRADIGSIRTESTTLVDEINVLDPIFDNLSTTLTAANDRITAINTSITTHNTNIGAGTNPQLITNTNALSDSFTAVENAFGGSITSDYIGSDTTIIDALNTLAGLEEASLGNTYLQRDSSTALAGTLNVVGRGITSANNTLLLKTGASDDDRLQINATGNIGINKAPDNTYRVDIDGDLNATKLFYAGTDIEERYLPASGMLTQNITFQQSMTTQAAIVLPSTITLGSMSFTYPDSIYGIIAGMVTDNSESTGLAATYQATDQTIDFDYSVSSAARFLTIAAETINGNTETGGISSEYNSSTRKINFSTDITRDLADLTITPDISFADLSIAINKLDIAGEWINDKTLRIVNNAATWTTLTDTSDSNKGVIEIATQTESNDSGITDRAMTPSLVEDRIAAAIVRASESARGTIEIATQAESDTGTDETRAMTPALVRRQIGRLAPSATTATAGLIEIASSSESTSGTRTDRVMTPTLVRDRIRNATQNATTGRLGRIEIATEDEVLAGTDTVRAITPQTAELRIATIVPRDASPTQKGRVQFATPDDLDDRESTNVVSVSDAYEVIRGRQRIVDTDWLFHSVNGQEVTDLAAVAIDCGEDITLYNYLEINFMKIFRADNDRQSNLRADNIAGAQILRLRVDSLPSGKPSRRGPGTVMIEPDNVGNAVRTDQALFYVWLDPDDNNRIFFELLNQPTGRLHIYNIFGLKNAGPSDILIHTLAVSIRSIPTVNIAGSSITHFSTVVGSAQGDTVYQWQSADITGAFSDVGRNSQSYDLTENTVGAIKRIRCIVTRGSSSTTSNVIISQWVSADITAIITVDETELDLNEAATFTVTATGSLSGSNSFQWQVSTTSYTTGFTNISGAQLSTLEQSSSTGITRWYRCNVTRSGQTESSNVLQVTWS